MYKSIHIAQWYLKDPKRIELIDSGYNNTEYIKYVNELRELIDTLTIYKNESKEDDKDNTEGRG
jgi:hypothetical protein